MSQEESKTQLEDKLLVCKDCGNKFIWTAGEQQFFVDKGLQNIPKRCKICTAKYKEQLREKHPLWWVKCTKCGKKAEVTFEPKSDDILCEDCFNKEIEKRDKALADIGEKMPT